MHMASAKKRRKENKIAQQAKRPHQGHHRHADGDRRRRGGPTYEQGLAQKHALNRSLPLPGGHDEEE
jgi:hypothetical protein